MERLDAQIRMIGLDTGDERMASFRCADDDMNEGHEVRHNRRLEEREHRAQESHERQNLFFGDRLKWGQAPISGFNISNINGQAHLFWIDI